MNWKENIILIGMSTSGKSTVWKKLAKLIRYQFIDEDNSYEKKYWGISLVKEQYWLEYFFKTRKEHIKELSLLKNTVIGTGWWTWISDDVNIYNWFNIYIKINSNTLNYRFNSIVNKNHPSNARRKLLHASNEERKKVLYERDPLYIKNADLVINGNWYVDDIINQIMYNI